MTRVTRIARISRTARMARMAHNLARRQALSSLEVLPQLGNVVDAR